MNAVHLLGCVTTDPEMRYTSEGIALTTMRLVVNDRAEAEFIDAKDFGQRAEAVAKYPRKGSLRPKEEPGSSKSASAVNRGGMSRPHMTRHCVATALGLTLRVLTGVVAELTPNG